MATPNKYVPGQIVVLSDAIANTVSLAATDDNTDVVTVYKPDGTIATPSVAHGVTGAYSAQVTVDQAGFWEYVFKSTGAAAGAGRGGFWVMPVP